MNLAKSLLADAASLSAKAQAFDRSSRTIALGVCAPAPSWVLTPLLSSLYPSKLIQTEIAGENKLLSGLNDGSYQLIVLPFNPGDEQYFTRACSREHLSFALPKDHRCSGWESLSFAEMDGENMLLMNDIGFDVATLGNHEFDFGVSQLDKVIESRHFPTIACNVYLLSHHFHLHK